MLRKASVPYMAHYAFVQIKRFLIIKIFPILCPLNSNLNSIYAEIMMIGLTNNEKCMMKSR